MTAPTPDTSPKMIEATVYDLHFQASNHETGDDAEWTHGVADLLAAVTADRNASIQMHEQARALLDQTLTERDQARQMVADAPHACSCRQYYVNGVGDVGCTCWKVGL
jgi:hypothetical protein